MKWINLTAPLADGVITGLRCGDTCLISGRLYTARDRAHERIKQMLAEGKPLPFNLRGELVYYVGPTPAPEGYAAGAAGPTTSSRMDPFSEMMLGLGIKGMIGKGKRDRVTKDLIIKHGAVYFSSFGGAGAYLGKRVVSSKVVAFEDLGTEAVYEFIVSHFPVVVAIDSSGRDIYEHGF